MEKVGRICRMWGEGGSEIAINQARTSLLNIWATSLSSSTIIDFMDIGLINNIVEHKKLRFQGLNMLFLESHFLHCGWSSARIARLQGRML